MTTTAPESTTCTGNEDREFRMTIAAAADEKRVEMCPHIACNPHSNPELLECVECGELLLDDSDDEDANLNATTTGGDTSDGI